MRALIIGAGNIGLGFLGHLLIGSGLYEVTFIEASAARVKLINDLGHYVVITASSRGFTEEVMGPVRAISALDTDAVVAALIEADLVLTAVGKPNLARVAPLLREGLLARMRNRPRSEMHMVVVACENVYDNTKYLESMILEGLPRESRNRLVDIVSFPSCMVDRIVPNSSGTSDHPLAVTVEDYFQFVIDETALKAEFPPIRGVEPSRSLPAKLEQKLFTLNMLHGIVGYWGSLAGHSFVHEAIGDQRIADLARGALGEVGKVLSARHSSIGNEVQQTYGETIMQRFCNPHLRDPISRVTQQPIRKLGGDERLVRPARLAIEQGNVPSYLATGIAAAFRHENTGDAEAVLLADQLARDGIERSIQTVTSLENSHPLAQLIKADYLFSSLHSA